MTYRITITRTEYAEKVFEVVSENIEEAKELALSLAYDTDWSTLPYGSADYEIEYIESED